MDSLSFETDATMEPLSQLVADARGVPPADLTSGEEDDLREEVARLRDRIEALERSIATAALDVVVRQTTNGDVETKTYPVRVRLPERKAVQP